MAVGRRERRQEGECLSAKVTNAAPDPDPIMMFVMSLFAAAAMADDGVLRANRASAEDDFCAGFNPIGFEVVLRGRKWDKQNRSDEGFAWLVTLPRIDSWSEAFLLNKSHLEKNNALMPPVSGVKRSRVN